MAEITYSIINPSDAYTIKSDSRAVACMACLLVGGGQYGLESKEGDTGLPLFTFGGDPETWFKKEFEIDIHTFIEENRERIADCLDSILIGGIGERKGIEAVLAAISNPEERERAWVAYQDKKRSSMNDIGTYARDLAKAIRERQHEEPKGFQPVVFG